MQIEEAVKQFADDYLGEYRLKERHGVTEYVAKVCPVCKAAHDPWTFSINALGLANCKRGNCGFKGTYNQLMKELGLPTIKTSDWNRSNKMNQSVTKVKYDLPHTTLLPLTDQCRDYLHLRGFSDITIDHFPINSDPEGNLVFSFMRDGINVFQKFRRPQKYIHGDSKPKEWQVKNTEPILWNMDQLDVTQPIYITEGQMDCLALYEAGFDNVTSVPCGCDNDQWIENCWDFLNTVDTFVIVGDSDAPGQKMVDVLRKRLSMCKVKYVPLAAYPLRDDGTIMKDANEILVRCGTDALVDLADSTIDDQINGLINISHVEPTDPTTIHRIHTGFISIDRSLGGLVDGGLTIICGDAGSGKSTISNTLILSAINEGAKVTVYSGELDKEQFQWWLYLQAAGDDWVGLKYDSFNEMNVPYITRECQDRISAFLDNKLYLYDNESDTSDDLMNNVISLFEASARRYGTSIFLVDNVMSMSAGMEDDEYSAQAKIVNALKRFALRYKVHVIIVAHLRKHFGDASTVSLHDISGNSVLNKTATNAIYVADQKLRILKNRGSGVKCVVPLVYCRASRRVYESQYGDRLKLCWDTTGLKPPKPRADSMPEYQILLPPEQIPQTSPF